MLKSKPNPDRLAFERIRQWLNKNCGMYYPEKKQELLRQRLQRVCGAEGFSNFEQLANALEKGYSFDVQSTVISAASTNHTYFFREPQVLNYFRDIILPTLGNETRIWSAAASTGDEAYTIAMIVAEARGIEWTKRNLSILGTDIDKHVIARAEEGVYKETSLENTPEFAIRNYFDVLNDGQYHVKQNIRNLCTFRRMNLKTQPYPFNNKFDVVFCRNVLYYFDEAHQRQVVESIYDVTKQGGWLLTSVTVSLRHLNTRWVNIAGGIYRKL
ncbi:MAG: protein-glutamate O-methyltransferase CheR [Methylococcales bacterium]|nr:protein-glutamate O-methyltransferase CheR [Methylococcales bacterium]